MADHGYPAIRVGMHHGSALRRGDDWFGATVNLAARTSGLAGGGEVLLSEETRTAAGEIEGLRYVARGTHRLRNVVSPVRVFAVASREQADELRLVIDPVCRMAADPERSAGRLMHDGREFYFCSLECAGRFAAAPNDYTG
jgi:adenylate cyclase